MAETLVARALVPLRAELRRDAGQVTQALPGEPLEVDRFRRPARYLGSP